MNQQLLLQAEYLAEETRILRAHAPARLRLSDAERATLGNVGNQLGCKCLSKVNPGRKDGDDSQLVAATSR